MDQLGSDIAEPRAAAAPAAKALLAVLRGVQDFLFETSEIRGCDLKTFFIDDVLRFLVDDEKPADFLPTFFEFCL